MPALRPLTTTVTDGKSPTAHAAFRGTPAARRFYASQGRNDTADGTVATLIGGI